jgi:uncharacterized Zn-finger protein
VRDQIAKPESGLIQANAQHEYTVTRADLPLSCPMPDMYLWNSHPKVYLPVEETGEARCPYCSAKYYLVDEEDTA